MWVVWLQLLRHCTGGLRSLVYCSFPKSLAFCSASALWATSPLPVLAT